MTNPTNEFILLYVGNTHNKSREALKRRKADTMTQQELKQQIINAQAAVAKRQEIIEKLRKQLQRLVDKGAEAWEISVKRDNIQDAIKKLAEANAKVDALQNKYRERISTDDYIAANTPEPIVEFLQNWQDRMIDAYHRRYDYYVGARRELNERHMQARREAYDTLPEYEHARKIYGDNPSTSTLINLYPSAPVNDYLEARKLDHKTIIETLNRHADSIILAMYGISDIAKRTEWLKKTIEREKRDKMITLMARITKVVGMITDAKNLKIGANGEINGEIIGTEGRARIETIGAGGYNIQCFHFRTLIHEAA